MNGEKSTLVVPAPKSLLTQWPINRIKCDPEQPRKRFDDRAIIQLANNLAAVKQQCPIIGYLDPSDNSWLVTLDGERRVLAARRIPWDTIEAIVLPSRPISPSELLIAQLSTQIREKLTANELAEAYSKLMTELKLNQAQLAARLGISAASVSNAFAFRRIDPTLLKQANEVEPCIALLIARLASAEEQATALGFAQTPGADGKRPSRDEVQQFIAAHKPTPARRNKAFAGKTDGRSFKIEMKPDETNDTLVEFLKGLVASVQRLKTVPVAKLGSALGG